MEYIRHMKKQMIVLLLLVPQFLFPQTVFNILSYGAVPDSLTNNTASIQKAVDDCFAKGGGTVYVPPGKYLTGTIRLKSNINLYLEAGAVLKGSASVADYPSIGMSTEQRNNSLIVSINADNISISGRGTIDGNGRSYIQQANHADFDFDRKLVRQKEKYMVFSGLAPDGPYAMKDRPGVLILLINCTNVSLKDFSIVDAPNWCLHLGGCRYTNIQSLTILNSLYIPNADGIDASNCQFLTISNCNIIAGDDGIAISPCADGYCSKPSENYTVSNCNIVSRSAGIRVGYGVNDIRNFVFQNITIRSNRGIGLFVRQNQHIENVLFSNIVIQTAFMDGVWWGNGDPIHISAVPQTTDTTIGQIRNIRFSNMRIESENGIDIYSISRGHIRDIVFDGISLHLKKGPLTEAYGGNFDLRPVHDVSLKVFSHDIAALYAFQADGITIRDMQLEWDGSLPAYYNHGIWFQKSGAIDVNHITLTHAPASLKGKSTTIEN